jgi:hypothetical protein
MTTSLTIYIQDMTLPRVPNTLVQLVRWDMSCDLELCSTHFRGEQFKAIIAHVPQNELKLCSTFMEPLVNPLEEQNLRGKQA